MPPKEWDMPISCLQLNHGGKIPGACRAPASFSGGFWLPPPAIIVGVDQRNLSSQAVWEAAAGKESGTYGGPSPTARLWGSESAPHASLCLSLLLQKMGWWYLPSPSRVREG